MVLSKWWLWARIMILVHKKNHDLQYNSTLKKSRGEKLKKKRKKASSQSLKKFIQDWKILFGVGVIFVAIHMMMS